MVLPITPNTDDSVKIVYTYTTPKNPATIFSRIVNIHDSIVDVAICSGYGLQDGGVTYKDTINLGKLNVGNYTCNLSWYRTFITDTSCLSTTLESIYSIGFTVNAINVINGIANRDFLQFTTNQLNINIDESLVGAQLNIYNVTGSLVQSAQLQMPNSKFEIQNLPNGVYVAVVTTPKSPKGDFNTVMRRWVKM